MKKYQYINTKVGYNTSMRCTAHEVLTHSDATNPDTKRKKDGMDETEQN